MCHLTDDTCGTSAVPWTLTVRAWSWMLGSEWFTLLRTEPIACAILQTSSHVITYLCSIILCHMTYEVGPTESLILLHNLMMRSQFASPRPLVVLTGWERNGFINTPSYSTLQVRHTDKAWEIHYTGTYWRLSRNSSLSCEELAFFLTWYWELALCYRI